MFSNQETYMSNTADTKRPTKPLKIRITSETYARAEALAAARGLTMGALFTDLVHAERKPALDRRAIRAKLSEAKREAMGRRA
jgi:hypothetical protein